MNLKDKVAIVTGASRGIGKAIAVAFAKEGAAVVAAARSQTEGKIPGTIHQTIAEIHEAGGKGLAIGCDVSDENDVADMVGRTMEEYGRIDVLVNNAGVGYYAPIMATPAKHWDLVMRVNLRGPFLLIQAAVPRMKEQGQGAIVNISSTLATELYSMVPGPDGQERLGGSSYGASKAGLERLTRGLALELVPDNIAVNALKPKRPTYSEGIVFNLPDNADPSVYRSADEFMTQACIFLAQQDAKGVTGGVFLDEDLCREYGIK